MADVACDAIDVERSKLRLIRSPRNKQATFHGSLSEEVDLVSKAFNLRLRLCSLRSQTFVEDTVNDGGLLSQYLHGDSLRHGV